eukprot:TRINITY_DN23038_c0_g1_i1.p1 TRINITY_DN23038_c0_g1~~TRINITY_DN23038_c0_g1_i1.p1  ORF type:complete len:344 (-),score=22.23 TRINITY_DN23038_c0_g1_i1:65-1096(-)
MQYVLGHGATAPFLARLSVTEDMWELLEPPIIPFEAKMDDIEKHVSIFQGAILLTGLRHIAKYTPGGKWEFMPELGVPRPCHLVPCAGKLYAIGSIHSWSDGFVASARQLQRRSSFDVLASVCDAWQSLPALSDALLVHTVHRGHVLAVGRFIVAVYLNAEEEWGPDGLGMCWQYDTWCGTWFRASNMPTPRRQTEACVLRGAVYVFGGCSEVVPRPGKNCSSEDFTVEFYVPGERGTPASQKLGPLSAAGIVAARHTGGSWRKAPPETHVAYTQYVVPSDQSCVLAIGGSQNGRTDFRMMECLLASSPSGLPGSGSWLPLSKAPRESLGCAAAVVPYFREQL